MFSSPKTEQFQHPCCWGRLYKPECFWTLNTGKMQWFHPSSAEHTPPLWPSHLFVVFDLVVQDDPVGVLGLLPGEGHAVPGCPVLPYDCDGGWSCRGGRGRRGGREANWVYLCSSSWQRVRFSFNPAKVWPRTDSSSWIAAVVLLPWSTLASWKTSWDFLLHWRRTGGRAADGFDLLLQC